MVHLRTFGRLELRAADGDRVPAVQTRPKDLALLTYLSLAGPFAFVRRDSLLALFWPGLDAAHGRNALSQALHRLRKSLPGGVLVIEGRDSVGISPARLSSDATSFEAHLEAGELSAALRLYAGDFLAGFHAPGVAPEFEDWIVTERERLHRLAFNALLLVVEGDEKSGNLQGVKAGLRRALAMRPYDETICRRLIEALAAGGDRAGALAEFDRFAQRLHREYGLLPSTETRAARKAIGECRVSGSGSWAPHVHTGDRSVVEAFLRGRYFTSTMEQTARGLQCLQQALALDPEYAPAHAAIALSLANLAIMGHLPPKKARTRCAEAARRALDIDPALGEAHTAVGVASMLFDWDWNTAERELRTAIRLNPNSSDAHAYCAQLLCASGRAEEGIALAEAARDRDPLGLWANFVLGWALFRARRHEQSVDRLRGLLELYPHFAYAHLFLAENHLSRAAYAEAAEACRTALELLPEDQLLLGLTACVMGLSGEPEAARMLAGRLAALARSRYVCPGHRAAAHLGLGERSRAFECWTAMCGRRSALACLVPADPLYDCVRDDVRFDEVFSDVMSGRSHAAGTDSRAGEACRAVVDARRPAALR